MKIEEQVLSREQMAHLSELGVDTSDASMIWLINKDNPSIMSVEINDLLPYVGYCSCDIIATYTIGDLIEKLPKFFYKGDEDNLKMGALNGTGAFSVGYNAISKSWKRNGNIKDALYNLLCWVVENHKGLLIKNI